MDQQEVLVHVTAPSRLRDDRRYQKLADELARFEIAALTPVYGFVGLRSAQSIDTTSGEVNLSFYPTTMTDLTTLSPAPRPGRVQADFQIEVLASASSVSGQGKSPAPSLDSDVGRDNSSNFSHSVFFDENVQETPVDRAEQATSLEVDSQEQHSNRVKRLGQWQVVKDQAAEGAAPKRRISNNPPYKNPFHGGRLSKTTAQPLRTPQLARPQTAPAGSTGTIQVPRTLNPGHKRSASDSFLDGSSPTASTVSDSQSPVGAEEKNSHAHILRPVSRLQRAATMPPRATFSADSPSVTQNTKRRRLSVRHSSDSVVGGLPAIDATSAVFAESTFETNYLLRPPAGCQGPYFLRDRSEDWTSPPESSATNSSSTTASSTLSPSQPLALRLSQTRISPPTSGQPPCAVDLTFETQQIAVIQQRNTYARMPSSPAFSQRSSSPRLPSYDISSTAAEVHRTQQIGSLSSSSQDAGGGGRYDVTSSIRSLPDRHEAPLPPVGSGPFKSHISAGLSSMTSRLPLSKYFRPVEVTRDVHVLERGHWSIRVKIASDEDVAEARRLPTQDELLLVMNKQMVGVTPKGRDVRYEAWKTSSHEASELGILKRCDLWTEREFLSFWDNLRAFVEEGKAGHHLSVAKDFAEEALTPGRATQSTYARIRVYTWGEVLGHVWLALWVLSDKKTAYIPMEWIASDDTVVVKMSGNRYKGGKLGSWVPKGSPGGRGSWGIETGTPPGNQGKHVHLPSS